MNCTNSIIAKKDTHDTSEGTRKLVKALFGVEITPLESATDDCNVYRVHGYANESVNGFEVNKGYTFEMVIRNVDSLDGDLVSYNEFGMWPCLSYDKVIRSHDEFKAEMDRLWASSTYDERFVLKRLYEFLSEPYPRD